MTGDKKRECVRFLPQRHESREGGAETQVDFLTRVDRVRHGGVGFNELLTGFSNVAEEEEREEKKNPAPNPKQKTRHEKFGSLKKE